MLTLFKILLVLDPQEEGGWTVTSPILPELITEIDELAELHQAVGDAIKAVLELYKDMKKELPTGLTADGIKSRVWFESLISAEL